MNDCKGGLRPAVYSQGNQPGFHVEFSSHLSQVLNEIIYCTEDTDP